MATPWPDRLAALADEDLLSRLAAEAEGPSTLSGPLAPKDPGKLYLLPPGEAKYDVRPENSLAAEAERRGTSPARGLPLCIPATDGPGLLSYPVLHPEL